MNKHFHLNMCIEESLEVKLPTTWTDEAAEVERVREEKGRRTKTREEKEPEKRRCRCSKGRKVAKRSVFAMFCTSENWKVGSLHAYVVRTRFRSHRGQNTSVGMLLALEMSAKWREARVEVKTYKTHQVRALLELGMIKKCSPLWPEARAEARARKTPQGRSPFGRWGRKGACCCGTKHISNSNCTKHHMFGLLLHVEALLIVAGAMGSAPCPKWAQQREDLATVSKTMAGMGCLKKVCKDGFRVDGAIQETSPSDMLGGQGADFLRTVEFWSIRPSGLLIKMILRDGCSTSYDLASLFHGKR